MRAITAPKAIFDLTSALKREGKSIGFVPTMGALHEGHLSLIRESLEKEEVTIVSIFVNPLQFNKEVDLLQYPKTQGEDLIQLKHIGVDIVFNPSPEEFYPITPGLSIDFGSMEQVMEGKFRPGHFAGVAIAVSKFFHLIQPDRAYFGLKDLQQFLLMKKMSSEMDFPVEVVGVDTKREASGLAMSSRNQRLTPEGRGIAANLYKGLLTSKMQLERQNSIDSVRVSTLAFYEQVEKLEIEYFEIVDGATLQPVDISDAINELAICVAGYVEGIRLIDSLYLQMK